MTATNGKNLNDPLVTDGLDAAYRVSWYGYVGPIIKWCILGAILLFPMVIMPLVAPLIFIIWPVGLILRILGVRSIRVYANQAGVWRYQGIFPWSKSIAGVRWHNIDEATTNTGFLCWATRAYPVWVTNRYTKQIEIGAYHINHGDELVARINQVIGQQHAGGILIEPITKRKLAPQVPVGGSPTAIE